MITFTPLKEDHFPLLLKWLMTPHVRAWWDQDVPWTPELIEEKYGCYVQGFKRVRRTDSVIERPVHAFVIEHTDTVSHKIPIGYIQYYDRYDWLPSDYAFEFKDFPKSLAAIDVFIGEESYIGKGIGSKAIDMFAHDHVLPHFDACMVDPDTINTNAIRAYQKAGFETGAILKDGSITIMVIGKQDILTH